jgi:hypothetical protein
MREERPIGAERFLDDDTAPVPTVLNGWAIFGEITDYVSEEIWSRSEIEKCSCRTCGISGPFAPTTVGAACLDYVPASRPER